MVTRNVYLDFVCGGESVDMVTPVVADVGATWFGQLFGTGLSSKGSHSISASLSSSARSTSKPRI